MNNRLLFSFFTSVLVVVLAFSFAAAPAAVRQAAAQTQEDGLVLRFGKVFGYSGFGNRDVQGTMKLSASGPEDLQRVVFLLDEQTLAEDTEAPFEVRFNTDSYALGVHTLSAVGYTAGGGQLQSNAITTQFVTASQGMQRGLSFAVPLLIVVFGAMLLSFVVPLLLSRGKKLETPPGAERNYGATGGTICPRCQRPFPLHLFAPNMGPTLKLERCPYCGRWGIVRRRALKDLRAAEAAELALAGAGQAPAPLSEEEKLRKELEDSRYHDV